MLRGYKGSRPIISFARRNKAVDRNRRFILNPTLIYPEWR
jgi:hypothetical protein